MQETPIIDARRQGPGVPWTSTSLSHTRSTPDLPSQKESVNHGIGKFATNQSESHLLIKLTLRKFGLDLLSSTNQGRVHVRKNLGALGPAHCIHLEGPGRSGCARMRLAVQEQASLCLVVWVNYLVSHAVATSSTPSLTVVRRTRSKDTHFRAST